MNKASTAPDTPKVRTRPRETPRATKMLQKASKGPLKEGGPQDARTRNEKCDFLVVKSMLIEALKEGESRSRHKGFP